MKSRAFTLGEFLTAVIVVLILASLIFPVLARARLSGYRAESIAHLRQIGAALELYKSDNDSRLAFRQLDPLVQQGYAKPGLLLMSHTDAFIEGYGRAVSDCIDQDKSTTINTSYETLLFSKTFYDHVMSFDSNAAIVVDRTHGDVLEQADQSCKYAQFYYSGPILRLYEDTSVKIGRFSVVPHDAPSDVAMHWSRARLFTDVTVPSSSMP